MLFVFGRSRRMLDICSLVAFALAPLACAPRAPAQAPDNPAPAAAGTADPAAPTAVDGARALPAPATAGTSEPSPPAASEPSPPPPAGTPALPAVTVKNVGLHVGGGPNDATFKAPLLKAIEQRFPDLLRCYRLVSDPGTGGTFGLDLHIERTGGKARVAQPRTALGDDTFKDCMVAAFESVSFPQLARPTVISYSLRFNVE